MAGLFKTLGSTLQAVDTIAASGSRRLSVWAAEQEAQTKYRHVARMLAIQTDCSQELAAEITRNEEALKQPNVRAALDTLLNLDKAEAAADAK